MGLTGWTALHAGFEHSTNGEWMVPLISAFLCYQHRERQFAAVRFTAFGLLPFALGLALCRLSLWLQSDRTAALSAAVFGLVIATAGAFLACYGREALYRSAFPLALLLFAVPLPSWAQASIIRGLQYGSAAVTGFIFQLLGQTFVRDGLSFYSTKLSIEIAPQCSGIRSSFALLVMTALLAHYGLRSGRGRFILMLACLPMAVIKNGIRIATLSLLSIYVDRGFLEGPLHHQGGSIFFTLGFAAEIILCWWLRILERKKGKKVPEEALEQEANSPLCSSAR